MFIHQGIHLPDGERHFPAWMTKNGEVVDGVGTYQIRKLREAMKHCREFRVAVDVGAHVGLWAMQLLRRFGHVHAFEPVAQFRDCLALNCVGPWSKKLDVYPVALGACAGEVAMEVNPADTGGTHVGPVLKPGTAVPLRTLDSYAFADVDFVKIDCEGYELEVLKGATDTLERCRPCVIVEQKPHKLGPNFGIKGTPAVDFLRAAGYELKREMGGDYIMTAPAA